MAKWICVEGDKDGSEALLFAGQDLSHHPEKIIAVLVLQKDQDPSSSTIVIAQLEIDYGHNIAKEDKLDFLVSVAGSQFGSTVC